MSDTSKPQGAMPAWTDAKGEPVNLGEFNGFEVYPMPMFATLTAEQPAELAAWYERVLGFRAMMRQPVLHLRRERYQDLLIVAGAPRGAGGPVLTFQAGDQLDAIAERAHAEPVRGRSSVTGPVATPWNTRDLRLTDPEGHTLVFTAVSGQMDPAAFERWRAAAEAARKG